MSSEQTKSQPGSHRRMSNAELSRRLNVLQSCAEGEELRAVLHEVEVYQIELEMQNRELKESRAALEDSHERYVNLYDYAPVGYLTLTEQGVIKELNLTASGMIGVERNWLVDRTLSPWIFGADLPVFRAHLRDCRQVDTVVKTTLRLANREKKLLPVELATSRHTDAGDGSVTLRTAMTDLSARRRAEAELDQFFNLSGDLLCILTSGGRFKRVNPACEKILGYSSEDLIGRYCLDFVHADDREKAALGLRNQCQEGVATSGYQRYLRSDRKTVWISWSAMASSGVIYCVGRDISEQIRAKEEAEKQYSWLAEMVERIPMPLTLVESGTGVLVSASDFTEVLYKGSPRSVADFAQSEAFCADGAGNRLPTDRWPRMRAASGEELNNEPVIWRTPETTTHLLASSRMIPGKYGQPSMAVIVSQDVTPLKHAEESLRKVVEKLSLERELRESFVFALTHDLRTPLTAAKMGAQLLKFESHDAAVTPALSDRIVKSIDRIDHMIQDLLDANRIRAGEKLPLKLNEFDLTDLVQDTLDDLSLIHGKRFVFEAQEPAYGCWSKNGLRRVIENLASNAVKYGAKGQPIQVTMSKCPSENRIVLSVQNHGNPIPIEDLPTLFQQFRRTAFAQSGEQNGWGIGLTLVRGILEAHGGDIQVESNRSDGTTFRARLPMKAVI